MKQHVFIFLSLLWLSFGFSQTIYDKDDLTILADSLSNTGLYKRAISLRKEAIKTQKKASKDYRVYLDAKYHHTKSCDYEFDSYSYYDPDKNITKEVRERYLDSGLQSAIKARDLLIKMEVPDRMFQSQVQSRIYHQTAYLGNWKHALEQAQLGYEFLKDTLTNNDKVVVDWIYDLGYIYSKLGDYSKSVENFQSSIDLYLNVTGDNNFDIGLSYNNLAIEYSKLGLRKLELESLLKAQNIWEKLDEESVQRFLYTCYGNLFYWYSYYGDFDKAEEYISKKNRLKALSNNRSTDLLFRNKEEVYKNKLSEWYDLMLHYSRKKDTIQMVFYVDTILKAINSDRKLFDFETYQLSSTLKFYASFIENENPEEALLMVDRAIAVQHKYKDIFYTKAFGFQLYKAELLLKSKKYAEAKIVLEDLNDLSDIREISDRFKLTLLNAKTAQGFHDNKNAKIYFDDAFSVLKDSEKSIEDVKLQDLIPLVSFETIEGFLAMGDFYKQLYKEENNKNDLKKASHRYFLASEIYNQLYLGQRYNERLFTTYNDVNERLMDIGFEQLNDKKLLSQIINSIENNGSKLIWSRFVFNNRRQEFAVPERFIDQEENIKAQLNFYQNALVDADENSEEKIALWKDKVFDLKNDLSKLHDSIKHQNNTYYQLNVKDFNVMSLQKSLKDAEVILKYVFTDDHLYAFLISNNNIQLVSKSDKGKVLETLKICLMDLKHRTTNYQESFKSLETILFDQIDLNAFKKLIIIPDGALNYFPFEALILNKKMPDISYASSLLLYQEQKSESPGNEALHIGAFSVSNNSRKLPRTYDEINAILKVFKGKSYPNASKQEFLQNLDGFNVLHLAMHSNIDELQPEFSSLNFYGDSDNRLFISELYNESLDADMAVLSACDTGSGFYENGEGVISLSRAFSYAGVPSTVMSLWKVDDEATAKIMSYFYEHLKKGETKDEALKNAKLDYLKHTDDDLLRHPYYWSGFVITGNTDALVEKKSYWIYLSIIPFVMLGFFRKKLFQFFKK
ncbi:CHAT domain-containing protein [Gelidibacter gilvus]|uniref:CHAT domain-containing protein n=2 Tax=Gelidibacter gilvus TaxID=59602 RepID=A0A4Q0X9S3_9FLAO|nr:CHAT domain-containing tetratricopeptide repeat protein [Gelidibacter gilvus]RXJ43787.1 CHAT domain-containing protein [Gelidibacter gilvus]